MPRIVLAGGLDHEREAFAAELADLWNDIPPQCELFHAPVAVITPDTISDVDALRAGSWIVHSNHFDRQHAKAVKYATQVVSIMFHESQVTDDVDYRAMLGSRDMITGFAGRYRVPLHIIFDGFERAEDELALDSEHWSALSEMGDFLRSQRLVDHRVYVEALKRRAWQAQQ